MASTLILAISSATPGWAGNWDKRTGLDQWIDYTLCDLNAGWHDAWHGNNNHDIDPTAIIPTHVHSCSETEVRVNDAFLGPNVDVGVWHCHDGTSSDCLSGHVHINLDKVGSYNADQKLSLMCQEVGHSVGSGTRDVWDLVHDPASIGEQEAPDSTRHRYPRRAIRMTRSGCVRLDR